MRPFPGFSIAIGLARRAGDPARLSDARVRPADLGECQVGSSTDGLPRGQATGLQHERCHPYQRLEWSSGRRDTPSPDFRKQDE